MCLKVVPIPPIPEDTRRVAENALRPNHVLRIIGERLSDFVCDEDFADLYPPQGQPGLSPALLAMVTALQFLEKLPDRSAAGAVALHIGWKYALHLPLSYPGFDHTVLCEFRRRLLEHEAEARVFDKLLQHLKGLGHLKPGGIQRTDSFAVLGAIRELNRLELVWETLRVALSALERADLEWLKEVVPLSWADRYGQRGEQYRLVREEGEEGKKKSRAIAEQVGRDGLYLLQKLDEKTAPQALQGLPEVSVLRKVWSQQYVMREGALEWPQRGTERASEAITTPHDPDVRYATKRDKSWEGGKVHVTETADEDQPHLVTDIRTAPAPSPDFGVTDAVQETLATKGLLPGEHLADSGYVTGEALATSQERGVELVGPARQDASPQARMEGGITADQFQVDREKRQVMCPAGVTSTQYYERMEYGKQVTHVEFGGARCANCALRSRCVISDNMSTGRSLTLRAHHELLQARRQEQQTPEFKKRFDARAGIEGTLSEMSRAHGLRQARYRGLAKMHLQNLMIAVATNLKRMARWWAGEEREGTRERGLRQLAVAAAA